MPIYEYVCKKCGHHLEVMQKMSDKPLSRCPKCRGGLEKMFSQTSFQLKGSGWYVSDYAKQKPAEADKAETAVKAETAENADKSEKPDKSEKKDKPEKIEKSEKSAKMEKSGKKETTGTTPSSAPRKAD